MRTTGKVERGEGDVHGAWAHEGARKEPECTSGTWPGHPARVREFGASRAIAGVGRHMLLPWRQRSQATEPRDFAFAHPKARIVWAWGLLVHDVRTALGAGFRTPAAVASVLASVGVYMGGTADLASSQSGNFPFRCGVPSKRKEKEENTPPDVGPWCRRNFISR